MFSSDIHSVKEKVDMQETTSKPVLARFVLFKLSVISAHDSHFAGGKHAFASMASTLAAQGFDVHVVSVASRGKVRSPRSKEHAFAYSFQLLKYPPPAR